MLRRNLGENHGHWQENEALGDDFIDDIKKDYEEHIWDSKVKVIAADKNECHWSEENTDQSINKDELTVFSVSKVSIVHKSSKQ